MRQGPSTKRDLQFIRGLACTYAKSAPGDLPPNHQLTRHTSSSDNFAMSLLRPTPKPFMSPEECTRAETCLPNTTIAVLVHLLQEPDQTRFAHC